MIQGEGLSQRLLGSKPMKFTGSGAHAIPAGYQCWGIGIRIDGTKITSITQNINGTPTVYVNGDTMIDTWLNATDLLANIDFIFLDTPITSFTLNAATDSVWCYCEPFLGYQEINPVVLLASVANATPTHIVLTFDRNLVVSPAPAITAFTPSGKSVVSVSISGKNVTVVVNSAYVNGNTITIGYTKPLTNYLRELQTGGSVVTFTGQSVTNNVS
jgi:Putative flagellar system-associated repeat